MKKQILSAMLASTVLFGAGLGVAQATPVNQQALAGATTVAQAKNMADDSMVTLKGTITRAVGNEKYEFRDNTGTIVAEIDHKLWQGRALQPNQTVTIVGEVEVDYFPFKTVEIDVKEVRF